MFPIGRALLVINRTSGAGQRGVVTEKLTSMFQEARDHLNDVRVEMVDTHMATRACVDRFIRSSEAPTVVVAGGGGGTLRAVVEGICGEDPSKPLPGKERVRVGALRMGSGNVLAKRLGAPRDPVTGLRGLLENLAAGLTAPCCVMRCEIWKGKGLSEVHHAATLGGLGQFGRIPGDLARWHVRLPRLHRSFAGSLGLERLTNLEYTVALFLRAVSCALSTKSAETIEVHFRNQKTRLQLLSGVAMAFPIKALPFRPSVRPEAISIYLVPFKGRLSSLRQLYPRSLIPHTLCHRLESNEQLEIHLIDRDCIDFFLDEDPLTACCRLSFGVAGSLAFIPGSDYRARTQEGTAV